jgi:hypothetical protein
MIEDQTLDQTLDKMERLKIPADMFGNINPNWKIVMKKFYSMEKDID